VVDIVDQATRSRMMSGIRSKNTQPEIAVRRGLHHRGFRFRLHDRRLPGKPDIVLPRYRAVIFVHGCFWHGHDCRLFRMPSTREEFWSAKIEANRNKDRTSVDQLHSQGWRIATVWECSLRGKGRDVERVADRLAEWLHSEEMPVSDLEIRE
jgi:DNA mismatch endonuclease (patch repair protein)